MKLTTLTGLLLAAGFATTALAADQGGGQVRFEGIIIDAPCSIDPESADRTVNMGQISNKELNGGKTARTTHNFEIKLENCSLETLRNVTVTFSGTKDGNNDELLGIVGNAAGAGIRLTYAGSDNPIKLGVATNPAELIEGNNVLLFGATLKGSQAAVDVTPGDFSAITTFALNYQ